MKAIENEVKKQKGGFFELFLGILAAGMLGNMLAEKSKIPGVIRTSEGVIWAGEWAIEKRQGRKTNIPGGATRPVQDF